MGSFWGKSARFVAELPLRLGPEAPHQILKVGTYEDTGPEQRFFELLSPDLRMSQTQSQWAFEVLCRRWRRTFRST